MKATGCTVAGSGAVYACWLKGVVVAAVGGSAAVVDGAVGGTKLAGDRMGVIGETGGRGGEFERRRSQPGRPCCVEIVRAGMFSLRLMMVDDRSGTPRRRRFRRPNATGGL